MPYANKLWSRNFFCKLMCGVFALFTAAYLCEPLNSLNIFSHISYGNWILAHKSVPSEYFWTLSGKGKAWIDSSWLFDVVTAWTVNMSSDQALIFIKISLFTLATISLFSMCITVSGSYFFGSLFAILASISVIFKLPLSPALAGIAIFPLLILLQHRWCNIPASEKIQKLKLSLLLLGIYVIYANIHWSFILSLILFSLQSAKTNPGRKGLAILGLSAVTVFVNPYLGNQIIWLLSQLSGMLEYGLILSNKFALLPDFRVAGFILLASVLLNLYFASPKKPKPAYMLYFCLMTLASFLNTDILPFCSAYTVFLLCYIRGNLTLDKAEDVNKAGHLIQGIQLLQEKLGKLNTYNGLLFLLCSVIYLMLTNTLKAPVPTDHVLIKYVDYLEKKPPPLTVLSASYLGDYLAYRFRDKPAKIIMDTESKWLDRDNALMANVYEQLSPGWKRLFGPSYNKDFLANRASANYVICNNFEPICQLLEIDKNWKLADKELRKTINSPWRIYKLKLIN